MKKKEIKEEVKDGNEGSNPELLTKDFGREDLNELRDKINELIKRS